MTGPPPLLFCFHHAGAGASAFGRWPALLNRTARVVPVPLPGRDGRSGERRLTDPDELLAYLDERIGGLLEEPHLFYGHSMGGFVAHALASHRQALGLRPPALVAVGAALPPDRRSRLMHRTGMPDQELVELLVSLGGLPPEATAHGGIWQRLVVPVIRDDLRLAQALCALAAVHAPLTAPLLAIGGSLDPISPVAQLSGWERYAAGGFQLRTVPGDHFFVRSRSVPLLLRDVLAGQALRPGSSVVPAGGDRLRAT